METVLHYAEKIMAELEKHKDDAKRKSVKIEQISSQWVRYMDESNELRKERDDLKSRGSVDFFLLQNI